MRMLAVAAVVASSGCGLLRDRSFRESRPGRELLTRASFDLDCPENEIAIDELGDDMAGAWGCSRRATYVWDHDGWMLNSPGTGRPETRPSEGR
jgi:hypothetical protein